MHKFQTGASEKNPQRSYARLQIPTFRSSIGNIVLFMLVLVALFNHPAIRKTNGDKIAL